MNLFEIKAYTQIDQSSPIVEYICELVSGENNLSLKQSWENGYHICLFGLLEKERAEKIKNQLTLLQQNSPKATYDVDEFKRKYEKVARLTHQQAGLEPVFQNTVQLTLKSGYDLFENKEQLSLYLYIHHIFDRYFVSRYFRENDILDIMIQVYPFVVYLPETSYEDSVLVTNGYTSHLSHYIGLLNSLKPDDRKKVREQFDQRVERDIAIFNAGKGAGNPDLLKELQSVHQLVTQYLEARLINFFSPAQFGKDILPQLPKYSERHAPLFREKKYRDQLLYDPVSCTNKWILNVLYEKLVLMNIKPIDKFYMNYFFSRLKYHDSALEVM